MSWLDAVKIWLGGPKRAVRSPTFEEDRYAGPGGPHYVMDKYDEPIVFYVVTGAPSQRAAMVFVIKRLAREGGAGIRNWPLNRVDEIGTDEPIRTLHYRAGGRMPQRRRRK